MADYTSESGGVVDGAAGSRGAVEWACRGRNQVSARFEDGGRGGEVLQPADEVVGLVQCRDQMSGRRSLRSAFGGRARNSVKKCWKYSHAFSACRYADAAIPGVGGNRAARGADRE